MPCKTLECCDEDDFPQTSSAADNCPIGYYWDGEACARCDVPPAPSLTISAGQVALAFNVATGLAYRVERQSDGHWMSLTSGTGGGGAESYTDSTPDVGTTYLYRITVAVSDECGYIEGEPASAVAV